jgi:hypothetical protein
MCTHRRFSSCDGILKTQVGLVIGCAKSLNQATVYNRYKKTNRNVIGTKAKPVDFDVAVVVDVLSGNFPGCRWVIVLAWW